MDELSPRLLIPDDHLVNQVFMSEVCDAFGWRYEIVGDGAACIEALMHDDVGFDLILMDIHMPGTSGIAAAAQIRSQDLDPPKSIPIVAVTADVSHENRSNCSQAGIDRFLGKPVRVPELKEMVEDLLAGKAQ